MDTDSLIFVYKIGDPSYKTIPISDKLGGWANELDEDDCYTTFIALGAKTYWATTRSGRVVCKIKVRYNTVPTPALI